MPIAMNEGFLKYPFVFLAAFLCAYLFTPLVRRMAAGLGIVDRPDARKRHGRATPRAGGIAVFLGFHCACAALYFLPWASFASQLTFLWWWKFLALSSLMLALGLLDDVADLPPLAKLAGQCAVALGAYAWGMRFGGFLGMRLPILLDAALTVIWIVAFVNAFNLIDGMDGLATGLACIAALGLAGGLVLRELPGDALVLLALVGACLAFLRYNFHPASIFLGDSGSMFLGFALATISLSTGSKDAALAGVGIPVLAVGIPALDTFLAIWRRAARRALAGSKSAAATPRMFEPDTDHMHHRLLSAGFSQRAAATVLYAAAAVLVAVGLVSLAFESRALGIYIVTFVAAVFVVVKHVARIELWDTGRAILSGLRRPMRKELAVILYPCADLLCFGVSFFISLLFVMPNAPWKLLRQYGLDEIAVWVGLPFLCLAAARAYSAVWSKARVSEYVTLVLVLAAGALLAAGFAAVIRPEEAGRIARQMIVFAGLAVPLCAGLRAVPRLAQDLMSSFRGLQSGANPESEAILVFGGGDRTALFLNEQSLNPAEGRPSSRVIGLLSTDSNLYGRRMHGHNVLGGLQHVDEVLKSRRVDAIVLTEHLKDVELQQLLATARRHGVSVAEWRTSTVQIT